MVYRKAKQRARRVYSRGKSILSGSNILKNPIVIGLAAGAAKNAITGKKIIDFEDIKTRISKMDATNPLIFLGAGILAKNSALAAIGAFMFIDPPATAEKEEPKEYTNIGESEEPVGYTNIRESEEPVGYTNTGESEEPVGYTNVGENEEKTEKKRCVF